MSEQTPQDPWLSPAEASQYLGVTTRTLRIYVANGDLSAHRVKGSRLIRIRQSELDAMLVPVPTVGGDAA